MPNFEECDKCGKICDPERLRVCTDCSRAVRGPSRIRGKVSAELQALREVAEAARNLTNWDWLPMLNDNESPDTDYVRADVKKLKEALEKVPR
jgi:hypothetical protein